jgi:hypothetical protein
MSNNDEKDQALQKAVAAMGSHFFDVTIICTTDDHQATYWMDVLETGLLQGKMVLAVSEDWSSAGGAGNGLGTLYAWQKACRLANVKYGSGSFDLQQELAAGTVSAALYHTAGKGTRMAPLPASENNNKPGVVRRFLHVLTSSHLLALARVGCWRLLRLGNTHAMLLLRRFRFYMFSQPKFTIVLLLTSLSASLSLSLYIYIYICTASTHLTETAVCGQGC